MAVLCLLTNTPWPWPTPAGAASARGGVSPTLAEERKRNGKGGPQAGLHKGTGVPGGCFSRWGGEARKTGETSCRAPGTESLRGLVFLVRRVKRDDLLH